MSGRWLPGCVVLAGVLLGAVSCGSESKEEEPLTPYAKYMESYVSAFCEALAPCCAAIPFDAGTCAQYLGLFVVGEASMADEKLFTFHEDRAAQCLADIRSMGVCTGDDPPSCNLVTEGTLAPGAACNASAECMPAGGQPGNCEADIDGKGGHCNFPATPALQGAACNDDCPADFSPCYGDVASTMCFEETGLHCEGGTCQPIPGIGAACSGFDCVATAYCSGGSCVARTGAGTACVDSESCATGTYCAGGVCTAQLPAGSVCDEEALTDQCLGGFCTYGKCMDLLLETVCALGSLE
jgi:hypothetical protein